MSQKQTERPQDEKPRPQDEKGPKTGNGIDIGSDDTEDLLREMDIIEHPERYTVEQRECGCIDPTRGRSGFR